MIFLTTCIQTIIQLFPRDTIITGKAIFNDGFLSYFVCISKTLGYIIEITKLTELGDF